MRNKIFIQCFHSIPASRFRNRLIIPTSTADSKFAKGCPCGGKLDESMKSHQYFHQSFSFVEGHLTSDKRTCHLYIRPFFSQPKMIDLSLTSELVSEKPLKDCEEFDSPGGYLDVGCVHVCLPVCSCVVWDLGSGCSGVE